MSEQYARYEKTFTLAVPVDKAWQAFTDPKLIEVWLTGTVEQADVRPGGQISWTPDEYGQLVWDIVEAEPGEKLTYREGPGILPVTTEVTVTFEEAEAGTRLTITQSGFGEGVDWQAKIDGVGLGWAQTLATLDLYLRTGVRLDRFFTFRSDLGFEADDVLAGPLVRTVADGSFAARAGVEPGDIVVRLGDAPVFGRSDLWLFTREHEAGEEVEVAYARAGEIHTGRAPLDPPFPSEG
ncbi:SRPBCC domain-containing protein [Phytohabitans kaempferiae]|uniref:SRPBCC domain-containing protein n=1 Tax=Phytohabitans kaempferiae TaxID=1620943 RepID=A0ABV6LYZ2_9ACTN